MKELVGETRYVGEVDLDSGPRYYRSLDMQKQVFGKIWERCGELRDRILTVHSLRSVTAVIERPQNHSFNELAEVLKAGALSPQSS